MKTLVAILIPAQYNICNLSNINELNFFAENHTRAYSVTYSMI